MANTIQGSFGWDNAPFVSAMADAERVATRGATNIEQRFAGVFKKSRAARGERAITNLLGDLTSGNIAQGLGEFAGRLTGLGIAASLGIGAAVVLFEKFRGQIVATREAHSALETEMTKRPLSRISKLSDEGMVQAMQAREKFATDLRTKQTESGFGSALWSGIKGALSGPTFGGISDKADAAEQLRIQQELNRQDSENKAIMVKRAELAMTMVNIEGAKLQGYEREAAISKIVLEAEQQRASLANSGISNEAYQRGDEAISRNAELQIKSENDRAKMKERSLAIEEKMANLIKKGLSAEDQKKVRAGLELGNINAQLASETSAPIRRQLLLQKSQKENELRGMAGAGPMENPYQFGTTSGRDWERQQDSAKFNSQFASFGLTQQQQDAKGPAAPNAEVVAAVQQVTAAIDKYFGEK